MSKSATSSSCSLDFDKNRNVISCFLQESMILLSQIVFDFFSITSEYKLIQLGIENTINKSWNNFRISTELNP